MQQRLYFLPLPQGQGAFRATHSLGGAGHIVIPVKAVADRGQISTLGLLFADKGMKPTGSAPFRVPSFRFSVRRARAQLFQVTLIARK